MGKLNGKMRVIIPIERRVMVARVLSRCNILKANIQV
jgi:hypothetical protein